MDAYTDATEQRERAFEAFVQAATASLGELIHEIVLYGSVARGEATEKSDVDVLVVLTEMRDTDELFQLAFDVGMEYEVAIIPHIQTKTEFESRRGSPFLKNVLQEGRSYG